MCLVVSMGMTMACMDVGRVWCAKGKGMGLGGV